jgi:hypothetical protein
VVLTSRLGEAHMSTNLSVDASQGAPTSADNPNTKSAINENALAAMTVIDPRKIHALLAYYVVLLIVSIAVVVLIIVKTDVMLKADAAPDKEHLLASLAFLVSGAIVGSVLYHIRMLSRYYIKEQNFNSKWVGKYITGPIEAVGLALAILSIIQGGAAALGGSGIDFGKGRPFAAFGFGALVGFGIREVVGWLATLAKSTFPTEPEKREAQKREAQETQEREAQKRDAANQAQ